MKKVISIVLIIAIIAIILLVIFWNNEPKTIVEESFYIANEAIYEKTGEININGIKIALVLDTLLKPN